MTHDPMADPWNWNERSILPTFYHKTTTKCVSKTVNIPIPYLDPMASRPPSLNSLRSLLEVLQ